MAIEVFARAKINLALHVTGRRADGYHLLDSLVAFAEVGDRITVSEAATLTLHLTGHHAAQLSTTDNLCLRAARTLHPSRGARITLEKNLPVAAGIGGGSADAAATLQALALLWSLPLPAAETILTLGADVPVCLAGHPARMQGIGETITPITLPAAWLVLVNPGIPLATAAVFAALPHRTNPALPAVPQFPDVAALAGYLHARRNDLEAPATVLAPVIGAILANLTRQPGCRIARMSGSGATCFGLFANQAKAESAAFAVNRANPGWWVAACALAR